MNVQRLIQIFLGLSALAFIAIGVNALLDPVAAMDGLELLPQTVTATNEIRANYGGMHIAFGLIMLAATVKAPLQVFALGLNLVITAGLVSGRVISLVVDGMPNDMVLVLIAVEGVSAVIAGLLLYWLNKAPVNNSSH